MCVCLYMCVCGYTTVAVVTLSDSQRLVPEALEWLVSAGPE